jgi:hypothetical protein
MLCVPISKVQDKKVQAIMIITLTTDKSLKKHGEVFLFRTAQKKLLVKQSILCEF